ncbi:hypothetical protein D049_3039 [Vibrio parahaemolyticus VPTS-2010]|nr:hypothetical protein D049_3039 [Vibrio parahaemolyticus VPTS-2010]
MPITPKKASLSTLGGIVGKMQEKAAAIIGKIEPPGIGR